ncbi:MAG: metalloregulator ArsR/SmtB family transcription factor [Limibacillus sp.]|jgi:DNA-binding transcriptional ArsR family regulator
MRYQGLDRAAKPASSLLKAVANDRRLSILCHLAHAEHAVGELSEKVGLSQSALSQHLAKLRRDNLVSTRREAQTIYYSLNGERVIPLLDRLHELFAEGGRGGSMADANGAGGKTAPAE